MKNYFKTIALVVAFSLVTLFSKHIQNTLISEYNKSVVFVQKHNSSVISPLGI
ncbi:hypothetical protein [Lacinutrix chionoecetis]